MRQKVLEQGAARRPSTDFALLGSTQRLDRMRYFVIFYVWMTNSRTGNGSLWLREMEFFPSNEEIKRLASEGQEFGRDDVVVTGGKEMNKEDFNSFTERT